MKVSERPVRWGVVGTGDIVAQMTSDLAGVKGAEVVAVASRKLSRAEEFADAHGIPGRFGDLEEMLSSDVDAVFIGTPHITHVDIADRAIARGRHVLCEKPMAMTAAEVRGLGEKAAEAGVFLMEAMWMKFNPLHRRLVELVNEGDIGVPRSVRATFGVPFPRDGSSRWRADMGGSTLLDQGIYPVTFAHMFLGVPRSVRATGVVRSDGVDLSDEFTLVYDDGRFMQGACSMVEFLDCIASVSGSGGSVVTEAGFHGASRARVTSGRFPDAMGSRDLHEPRSGNGFVPMLTAVVAALREGAIEHPWHTTEAAAQVFDTLDEIRRQIGGGRPDRLR